MTTAVLTDEQKAQFVTDIADYGTGFVAPLFAVVESIEQAVLQSEQVQRWKRDTERIYDIENERILVGPEHQGGWFAHVFKNEDSPVGKFSGESFREAIDAAMQEQKT